MKTKSKILCQKKIVIRVKVADDYDFNKISGLYDQGKNLNTNRTLISLPKLLHSTHNI